MNNTFKQALPVNQQGDEAEEYLFKVRQQADELGSIFSVPKREQKPVVRQPHTSSTNGEHTQVDMSSIYKECTLVFGELPEHCSDPTIFWKRAAPLVAAAEITDLELNGKESWKAYIKENRPAKLSHENVFNAIKVLSKMQQSDRAEHLQIWGWCLLLQVPNLLTTNEIGILRHYAQNFNDGFWNAVLATCFGQADLAPEPNRQRPARTTIANEAVLDY